MYVPENKDLEQAIQQDLAAILPKDCSRDEIAHVFDALWGVKDMKVFQGIVPHLLRQGIDASVVLECLLRCELAYMQHMVAQIHPDSLFGEAHELSNCVQYYHALKRILFAEVEAQWQERLTDKSIIDQVREHKETWLQAGEVELHNYFCDMPVRATFKLVDVEECALTVMYDEASAMVFVASRDSKTAYLAISGEVRLLVRGVERKGRKLRLVIEDGEDDQVSRRQHIRVATPESIPIVIHQATEKIHADIGDISDWGIGVIFSKGLGVRLLDGKVLSEGDAVVCDWDADGVRLSTEAVVRWIRKVDGDGYRAGLEMKPSSDVAQHVHQWMMQYQRKAITQLKSMNIPPWLRGEG